VKNKKFKYKIYELKKKENKKSLKVIINLIKKENTHAILSCLSKKLIYEYLTIANLSEKMFLFVIKKQNQTIGYVLYVKNKKYLLTEFKKMKFKIIKYLLLKAKFISIINILLAVTKLDFLFTNYFKNDKYENVLNLNLLAIKNEYQSMGIGKLFIEKTIQILLNRRVKFKYVSCEAPTKRVLKFYTKNKFKIIGKKIRIPNNLYLLKKKINEL
jgi:ribosomal protein S18 acetylase RimI-like enzyme